MRVAESDTPLGSLNYPGLVLIRDITDEMALRFCVAQQYFGMAAYAEPSADAWLSDAVSNYVSYLMLEDADGHDAFVKAINRDWVGALQLTIPGGLRVTSDAALFTAKHYDIVVKIRGAVVLHELREAMGLEDLLKGLRAFYELGRDGRTLTEGDFVDCMDAVTGRSWRDFLTDWVFNVGDYVNQPIDWLQ
jgi:aminopeptidase N